MADHSLTGPDCRTDDDMTGADRSDYTRLLWTVLVGMAVVAVAGAILSFDAWAGLARLVGITGQVGSIELAWLLPITVDVFAAVATGVWLAGALVSHDTRIYARANALGSILLSIVGNGLYHGLTASGYGVGKGQHAVDWKIVVAISAIPPLVLGLVGHLVALVLRDRRTGPQSVSEPIDQSAPAASAETIPVETAVEPADDVDAQFAAIVGAIPTQSEPVVTGPTGLLSDLTDGQLVDCLRWEWPAKIPSREAVMLACRVGANRADRLRGDLAAERSTSHSTGLDQSDTNA